MKRRQTSDIVGPKIAKMARYFLFAAKPEVLSGRWLVLIKLLLEIRLQSKMNLIAPRPVLSRPRQQLLLLLTKEPAAKEVVILKRSFSS